MITKPKGTYDIFDSEAVLYNYVYDVVKNYAEVYNAQFIRTPIFESSDLFHRSVGESSDIVSKETYDFCDRANRSITLRPEGTAGVVRSFIENKMYGNRNDLVKLFYFGTMYRYERPQSGRNREFTQFGLEVFNSDSVYSDAETISFGYNLIRELGIDNVCVKINNLGDKESRDKYVVALKEYLAPHIDGMCDDCKNRFNKNPLRILDCKVDSGSDVFKNMPSISDYISDESNKKFDELKNLLVMLDVDFEIDEKIVRGLDYYTDFVYEFVDDSGVSIGAGGRYDNLVETLGGPSVPANGFALGIERLLINLKEKASSLGILNEAEVYILAVSEEEKKHALILSQELRLSGIKSELCLNDLSLKSQFKLADSLNAKFLIIMNNEDLQKGLVNIKDSALKSEEAVDLQEVVEYLVSNL